MDYSLIIIYNKCLVECNMPSPNKQPYKPSVKPIWWKFACSSGCPMVNTTHVLFYELVKPLSCDNKPSMSKFDEFKSNRLYHTFKDGLHNTS
jgi:hypothetical protein